MPSELRVGGDVVICPDGQHTWEAVETPIDSARRWYRCSICGAYGSAKGRFKIHGTRPPGRRSITQKVESYRCSVEGCSDLAVVRLHGRGPRASYIWRCRRHK